MVENLKEEEEEELVVSIVIDYVKSHVNVNLKVKNANVNVKSVLRKNVTPKERVLRKSVPEENVCEVVIHNF